MNRDEVLRLFQAHRDEEAARDIDAILQTFVEDCFRRWELGEQFPDHRMNPGVAPRALPAQG